jgi:hypothetical protein
MIWSQGCNRGVLGIRYTTPHHFTMRVSRGLVEYAIGSFLVRKKYTFWQEKYTQNVTEKYTHVILTDYDLPSG